MSPRESGCFFGGELPRYLNLRDVLGFQRHAKAVAARGLVASFAGKLWSDVAEAAEVRGKVAALASAPGGVWGRWGVVGGWGWWVWAAAGGGGGGG